MRLTSLALVNTRQDGKDIPEHEELLENARDVIVVFDLDQVSESMITSALDSDYAEALPDTLAPRIAAWARASATDEESRVNKIVNALRVAAELTEDTKLVGTQVMSAYEKVLDAVMYGHPEAVLAGWEEPPAGSASEAREIAELEESDRAALVGAEAARRRNEG